MIKVLVEMYIITVRDSRYNLPIVRILPILIPQISNLIIRQLTAESFLKGQRDLLVEEVLDHEIQSKTNLIRFVNWLARHDECGLNAKN
jgi:hypothetical protein